MPQPTDETPDEDDRPKSMSFPNGLRLLHRARRAHSHLRRAGPVTLHDKCQPEALYKQLTFLRSSLSRAIAENYFRAFD